MPLDPKENYKKERLTWGIRALLGILIIASGVLFAPVYLVMGLIGAGNANRSEVPILVVAGLWFFGSIILGLLLIRFKRKF